MRPISTPAWLLAASLLLVGRLGGAAAGLGGPLVDLGYSHYRGACDAQHRLNTWRGIRYAAPPIGPLRWQMPQPPLDQRALGVIDATELPPLCPQAGAYGTPVEYGFNGGPGDEDCLYLNVYAPVGATGLPVLIWIHGGGYSLFGARYDPSAWIDAGGRRFVAVEIQYRLGAFGFLASPEVQAKGQLNAGLLDQRQALSWVQKYITRFGGDPSRVTIAGESSGAGSTLHHALAYNGRDDGLFSSVFVSSPYLPPVHLPDDPLPGHYYQKFAEIAGCGGNTTAHHCGQRVFECLVAADTRVLQEANEAVSATQGYFGTFAWLPVIDGHFVQGSPAEQLSRGRIAGDRILVGTNANEGVPLTNPRVSDKHEYEAFIYSQFPALEAADRTRIDKLYRIDEALEYENRTVFDTLGSSGPSALLQSGIATGIQQAVFNIAAESTFACPAQWLAEAFSNLGRPTWRYQYSLTPSYHGADLSALFDLGSGSAGISADFRVAFQSMLSAFISSGSPVISAKMATGGRTNSSVPLQGGQLFWPEYTRNKPLQLNLNTTGGIETTTVVTNTLSFMVRSGLGVVNAFNVADVRSWEAGRAERCKFWKMAAQRIPY